MSVDNITYLAGNITPVGVHRTMTDLDVIGQYCGSYRTQLAVYAGVLLLAVLVKAWLVRSKRQHEGTKMGENFAIVLRGVDGFVDTMVIILCVVLVLLPFFT